MYILFQIYNFLRFSACGRVLKPALFQAFTQSSVFLILHILHIIHYHQSNLESQGVIKFADIETGALLKLPKR